MWGLFSNLGKNQESNSEEEEDGWMAWFQESWSNTSTQAERFQRRLDSKSATNKIGALKYEIILVLYISTYIIYSY